MAMFEWREKSAQVLHQGGVIAPDERLPWPQTAAMGVQHVIAMFGATVLAPILMGFDPNIAILMSGVGTLLFFLITGGKVPSYLGSSFAFIGVVIAATAYAGKGPNANIGVALGGIIACGLVYTLIGALVHAIGTGWIERFMPPVVTGAVVAVIGLNLAGIPIKNMAASNFDSWMQAVTFVCVGLVAVMTRGMVQRLLILVGLIVATVIYGILTNGMGLGKPIDFSGIANAAWVGAPAFAAPVFSGAAMMLIAPVAIILVAENLGHIKAVTAMTGRNLDQYMGRAFMGDGIATMVSGAAGGTGVTTYAENIGVMAATKIYSTAIFVFAAAIAVVLGFSPKFGAVIQAIPLPVMGGVSIVVFGLIAIAGAKIWVDNRVDFSQNKNLIVAAVTLVLGTGDFTLKFGGFALGGIGTATFGAILLYALLGRDNPPAQAAMVADSPVTEDPEATRPLIR
jgi:putative pyrimidine permease RutG